MHPEPTSQQAVILLAAGESSRMGRSKQLLQINGEALLIRMIKEALQISHQVYVVLGARFEEHSVLIKHLPVQLIKHDHWKLGMGSSIKKGFEATSVDRDIQSIILMACDQPLLTAAHLSNLASTAITTDKPIIASSYGSTLGIPVLFKKIAFEFIRQLGNEEGARKIIQQQKELVMGVDFPGGEFDLDTPEDVERYSKWDLD